MGILTRLKKEYHHIITSQWTLSEVGQHWDETIDYDDMNSHTDSYFRRFIDAYALVPELPAGSYALDICCRSGNGTQYFFRKGKIAKAVCADVSEKMLDICASKLQEEKLEFQAIRFDQLPLPFQDGEFDLVLCFETVEHIAAPGQFLKEIARVAKPGGWIIVTSPNILWEPVHWLAAILNLHHSEGPHRFLRYPAIKRFISDTKELTITREKTTVLMPAGPKWLIKIGGSLEQVLPEPIMKWLGLRMIFICRKAP